MSGRPREIDVKIGRKFGLPKEFDPLLDGMSKAKLCGMEQDAVGRNRTSTKIALIRFIAEERMSRLAQVNPDLMSATRLEPALDERHGRVAAARQSKSTHVRGGGLEVIPHHAHPRKGSPSEAIASIARDRSLNCGGFANQTMHQSQVASVDRMKPKLLRERTRRLARFCEHDEPARLTIEPLHHLQFLPELLFQYALQRQFISLATRPRTGPRTSRRFERHR